MYSKKYQSFGGKTAVCVFVFFSLKPKTGHCRCSGCREKVIWAFEKQERRAELSGVLTREGRAKQEREAERGVRAVCSVGALPGGMGVRLPRQHYAPAPGFTIHYEQPQAASGLSDAQKSTSREAVRSASRRLTENVIIPLLCAASLGMSKIHSGLLTCSAVINILRAAHKYCSKIYSLSFC